MLLSEMSWRAVPLAAVGGCLPGLGLSERSYPIIDLFFQKPQTEFLKGRILVKFCKWLKYEVDYD